MDIAVSYARLLLADNSPTDPTYTDEEIESAITLGPPPDLPADVVMVGVLTFQRFNSSSVGLLDRTMDDVLNMDAVTNMDTLV